MEIPSSVGRWLAVGSLLLAACGESAAPVPAETTAPPDVKLAIDWFEGDVAEAFSLAREQERPVLLYWGAAWCPPCNQLKSTVFNRPDFIAASRPYMMVYLDGDTPGAQRWGEHFGAVGYPTLILFAPDGRERTRLSSGLPPERYAQVLAAPPAARPVARLLQQVETDPAGLSDRDWEDLAFYAWEVDQGRALEGRALDQLLARLAAACPQTLTPLRYRLQLLAAASRLEVQPELPPAQQVQVRQSLHALLENPALRRANLSELQYHGAALIAAASHTGTPEREALLGAYRRAMEASFADESLPVKSRLLTMQGLVDWQRQQHPEEAFPAPLKALVRERAAWADGAAATPYERQSLIYNAAGYLHAAGLSDAARAMHLAEIERAVAPHYYMSYLAGIEEDAGNASAALDWYRRAWEASAGPATRAQWGIAYAQALLRLDSAASERIEATVGAVIAALIEEPEAYYQRTRQRLAALDEALRDWQLAHPQEPVRARLHRQVAGLCERLQETSMQDECGDLFRRVAGEFP